MMIDIDAVSRYVDPLVYQYNMTAARFHIKDVTERTFAYSFDIFIHRTSPRHVKYSDVLSISITTVSITSIFAIHHSLPIKFPSVFPINTISFILLPDSNSRVLSFPIIPTSNIT